MLAMSSLMMPVPMLGAGQLVHKPPEAKLLAIHSHNQQPQATPQHHMQQTIHLQQPQQQIQQQQIQQQQSKPGSNIYMLTIFQNVKRTKKKFETGSRKEFNKNANLTSYPYTYSFFFYSLTPPKKMWEKFTGQFINSIEKNFSFFIWPTGWFHFNSLIIPQEKKIGDYWSLKSDVKLFLWVGNNCGELSRHWLIVYEKEREKRNFQKSLKKFLEKRWNSSIWWKFATMKLYHKPLKMIKLITMKCVLIKFLRLISLLNMPRDETKSLMLVENKVVV